MQLAQSQSPVQIQPTLDNKSDVKENLKLVSRPVSKPVSRPVSKKIQADNVGQKIYPETSVNKMLPGRYVFDTFHTKNMRNERIRTYLHLQAIDATGKRAGFLDGYATYGKSIEKRLAVNKYQQISTNWPANINKFQLAWPAIQQILEVFQSSTGEHQKNIYNIYTFLEMPKRKQLSEEELEEIRNLHGQMPAKQIQTKYAGNRIPKIVQNMERSHPEARRCAKERRTKYIK